MTAPNKLIPDCTVHVEDFAAYYELHPEWGIFHVVMSDGNWDTDFRSEPTNELEERLVDIFDQMTGSQRAKVATLVREFTP